MSKTQVKHFLYQIKPSRDELISESYEWTEEEIEIGKAHFSYLQQATEEGIVILAGRSLDGIGPAIVIIEVESEEEAREFMQNDPFCASGLMFTTLHPFRAALMRKRLQDECQ
jgi:uncharacterized protein YciI